MIEPRNSVRWRTTLRMLSSLGVAALAAGSAFACSKKSEPPTGGAPLPIAATEVTKPAASPAKPGAFGAGVISGTIKLKGKAPEAKVITTPDPYCAKQAIKEEDIVAGAGGGLKNVVVRIVKGAEGTYAAPSTPATVDQNGCTYRPRVQVVMVGQPVQIQNSDQTLHNVHSYKGASTAFNQAQLPGMPAMTKTFSDPGQVVKFKCDIHPWMTGYVAVSSNPFSAVTDADGHFTIEKLPAGAYTLEVWHERLGTKSADVVVTVDKPATADFELALP